MTFALSVGVRHPPRLIIGVHPPLAVLVDGRQPALLIIRQLHRGQPIFDLLHRSRFALPCTPLRITDRSRLSVPPPSARRTPSPCRPACDAHSASGPGQKLVGNSPTGFDASLEHRRWSIGGKNGLVNLSVWSKWNPSIPSNWKKRFLRYSVMRLARELQLPFTAISHWTLSEIAEEAIKRGVVLYAVWQLLNYNPYSKSQRFTNENNLYSPRRFTHSCLDDVRTDTIICFTISASTIDQAGRFLRRM